MLRVRVQAGVLLTAACVASALVLVSAEAEPQHPVRVTTDPNDPTTTTAPPAPTSTTDACDRACELDTWQRAVWQVAVWEQATATTTTTTAAVEIDQPAVAYGGGEVERIIREVWAGSGFEDWAVSIAWRESRHQPDVVSGEGALGLFQLLGHDDLIVEAAAALGRPADWSDPWVNALAARYLAERSGTCHWDGPNYCAD